ncbi:MAG: CsbD family protein [Solirubrobacteraceae bacterium]
MSDGTVDKTKGKLKEAAGDLTDDQSLKNEGKVDKASGSAKNAIGDAADKVKDAINPNTRN